MWILGAVTRPGFTNGEVRMRFRCLCIVLLLGSPVFTLDAYAKTTILECSGLQRAYNPTTKEKLPETMNTRVFKFDDTQKSIYEYVDNQWTMLDPDAEVDQSDISARYSRDYPDARVDIIFELNRINNSLIYLLDIDERPGELFTARCQIDP